MVAGLDGATRARSLPSPPARLRSRTGSALLMVLVGVSLLGLLAGIAGSSWRTIVQRAQEEDLLWKGQQIRRAIASYYNFQPSSGNKPRAFPPDLEALLRDPRALEVRRHLRRRYPDPLTGESWQTIAAPGGGIMGVRSTSEKVPFKQAHFSAPNKSFTGQASYQGWAFIYRPEQPPPADTTGQDKTSDSQ